MIDQRRASIGEHFAPKKARPLFPRRCAANSRAGRTESTPADGHHGPQQQRPELPHHHRQQPTDAAGHAAVIREPGRSEVPTIGEGGLAEECVRVHSHYRSVVIRTAPSAILKTSPARPHQYRNVSGSGTSRSLSPMDAFRLLAEDRNCWSDSKSIRMGSDSFHWDAYRSEIFWRRSQNCWSVVAPSASNGSAKETRVILSQRTRFAWFGSSATDQEVGPSHAARIKAATLAWGIIVMALVAKGCSWALLFHHLRPGAESWLYISRWRRFWQDVSRGNGGGSEWEYPLPSLPIFPSGSLDHQKRIRNTGSVSHSATISLYRFKMEVMVALHSPALKRLRSYTLAVRNCAPSMTSIRSFHSVLLRR